MWLYGWIQNIWWRQHQQRRQVRHILYSFINFFQSFIYGSQVVPDGFLFLRCTFHVVTRRSVQDLNGLYHYRAVS